MISDKDERYVLIWFQLHNLFPRIKMREKDSGGMSFSKIKGEKKFY